MRMMMKLALALILIIAVVKLLVLYMERKSTFYPARNLNFLPEQYGLKPKEISFTTNDGEKLWGWYFMHPQPEYTILFFHGNAENISHRLDFAQRILSKNFNLLLVDYRGYGKSSGSPSEKGIYRDAQASYAFLRDSLEVPPQKVVIWGISIGAAAALDLASKVKARAVILEGCFTSAKDMSRLLLPPFPWHWFMSYKFDNTNKISAIDVPVLFIHGNQDEIVPFQMGQVLYESANQPKEFYTVKGAGHNDTYEIGGEEYFETVKEFILKINP
jgi:fermentation-respiration switch protein FrsA (DUF1100 family)